jgi:hypothetical protein
MHRLAVIAATAAAAAVLAIPLDAHARRRSNPQAHEVRVDVDISVANQANASFIDAQYSYFFPSPLQSEDEVAPALRRFVRHPSEIFVRLVRDGSTIDTRTSLAAGSMIHLVDGVFYVGAQAGVELDDVRYDPSEGTYVTAPVQVDLGGRPHPLVSIGAYGYYRPVLDSSDGGIMGLRSTRDGYELEAGGKLAISTPADEMLLQISLGYRTADFEFDGVVNGGIPTDGAMTIDGLRGSILLSVQASPRMSFLGRVTASREFYDNNRLNQDVYDDLEAPFEQTVYTAAADLGMQYWYQKRLAFRLTAGGGYEGEKPHVNGDQRGSFRLGFGVITRF